MLKFCKSKNIQKILAVALVMTMTLSNLLFLGKNLITYAFEENLEIQGDSTQHSNVKFDAYFSDNGGNNVHSAIFDATNTQKMNLYISVKNGGYLKEAYIDFRDIDNGVDTNYEISADAEYTTLVQDVNSNLKTMALNYIEAGTNAVIEMPISINLTELTDIDKLKQSSLVTLRGIYVDENGREIEISKTVKLKLGWTVETELSIEQSITKYLPYAYEEKTGLLLQTSIKIKQNRDDLVLPVKSTELKIKVPEIAETLPEKIVVVAEDTILTNGNKVEFTDENWTYNQEDKTITINTKGFEENGLVWSGVGEDQYFVTYMYSREVSNAILENEIALHCDVEAKMELYSAGEIIQKAVTSSGDVVLTDKVGDIVTYNIKANQTEMSKGKMYANYNSETKTYDTEYLTVIKANISNSDMVEQINMQLLGDSFAKGEDNYTTSIGGKYYTTYKQIIINKYKMQKLLGEDGFININDGTDTYTINKETQDVDGNYIVEFPDNIGVVTVQTSKPLKDGILEIDAIKSISKDLIYSKDQVKEFESLKVNMNASTKFAYDNTINTYEASNEITLTETSTNAKLEISNTVFSSMVENKNVEMKIILNNNSETSDLYRNAVFTIKLPNYIEDIEITSGNILYTSGLKATVEKINTESGIVLKIEAKGAETKFSDGVFTNGTNIVLNTNIKVSEQTPNISDKIIMTYINENAIKYINEENGYGIEYADVSFVAPEEMVTFNTVLTGGVETTSVDGSEQTAKLEILDTSKIATMKIGILNKYSNVCNNIKILGRTPFVGNKEITTGNDLGTTFNAKLINAINTNGIEAEIYYSANENATQDLADTTNGWTTDLGSIESVKSYLIVLPNYEMQVGEKLEFTYNCQIPEGLEHNESAYGTYVVYFDSVSEYVAKNSLEATKVGLTTGVGANIEMETKTIYQDKEITSEDKVKEYQTVTYKTTVKNTGTVDAEAVKVISTIANATIIEANGATINGQELTWELGTILAGETKTLEYSVEAIKIAQIEASERVFDRDGTYIEKLEDGRNIVISYEEYIKHIVVKNNVELSSQNLSAVIEEKINNTVQKAELIVELSKESSDVQLNTSEISLKVTVKNNTSETINNVIVEEKLPEGVTFIDKGISNITYNAETRIVSINMGNIDARKTVSEDIRIKDTLPANVGELEIVNVATVKGENTDTYMTNKVKYTIISPVLNIELTSSMVNGSYIKQDSQIEITAIAKNIGKSKAISTSISIDLPDEFIVNNAYYYKDNQQIGELSKSYGNIYSVFKDMDIDETIVIKINATISINDNSKAVTDDIVGYMKANLVEEVSSNVLSYKIEKNENNTDDTDDLDNPVDPTPTVKTYKISGTAWLDKNEDGKKDSDEELIQDIDVLLIDAKTGVIVSDITNGTAKETTTSSKGEYTFTNIPAGEYMIIFEYDSAYYDITEYNKAGVTEDLSSKAIQAKIKKDGIIQVAGVTNTIKITDSSIANINIGLVEKAKFDLSLEKQLSAVTISNSSGTKTYTFDNNKLGKIDIPAKYLRSTTATIEYKIIVKNEGAVAGTAKKIVDYVSSDLIFEEIKNTGWYKGTDGNIYNDTLADLILLPGESKEIKLVLTKKITEENTGIITNKAEIYEDYNEIGYEDYNSEPGNKSQSENDLDYANLIITVKTGQTMLYITITIISIGIIAIGIYIINKKVMKGGRF